jgi:hypothetical protein
MAGGPSAAAALLRHPAGVLLAAAAAALVALALLAPAPPAAAESSPDESARKRLQSTLRRARPGKPVELFSQGRAPARAVFAVGGDSSRLVVKPDRLPWVDAPAPCLLELLPPDPERGPYLLTVEMAQTDGEGISQVGVYAGHRPRPVGDGTTTHGFVQATWCEPRFEGRKVAPELALGLAWFHERPLLGPTIPGRFDAAARLRMPACPIEQGLEFRTVTIEARPGRMGVAVPGAAPVTASRAELELVFRILGPKTPALAGYTFDVSPEGGAGLVVWRGAVVVRRAAYEPTFRR